eukprot:TRINITY_DN7276_c0_g1_i1.p1 TRINITY_DN7276_c0_g1~~TRINITY_DN7276_c0_g1_i1.p1  ORF type:complete len:818 (-),score=239.22 TRINITY_DN7276_c0_g1_i1:43-2196(-)
MKKNAESLKTKTQSCERSLKELSGNQKGLSEILNMERARVNMESTCEALRRVLTLQEIESKVDSIFQTNNFDQIAATLKTMRECVAELKGVPQFASSLTRLTALEERLEATSRPQILSAFKNYDTQASQKYAAVFEQMGRSSQLHTLYTNCRLVTIHHAWDKFGVVASLPQHALSSSLSPAPSPSASPAPPRVFADWLPEFYDEVTEVVTTEITWANQVFTNGHLVVSNLLIRAFNSITPAFRKRLEDTINPNSPVDDALALYTVTIHFVSALLAKLELGHAFELRADTSVPVHTPEGADLKEAVTQAVLGPFKELHRRYADLELTQLDNQLEHIKPGLLASGSGADPFARFDETVTRVEASISKVVQAAEEALERCLAFTAGSALPALVQTFREYFMGYVQHLFNVLSALRSSAIFDNTLGADSAMSTLPQDEAYNWGIFASNLRLMQVSNQLVRALNGFNDGFAAAVGQQKLLILASLSAPGGLLASSPLNYQVRISITDQQLQQLRSWLLSMEDRTMACHILAGVVQLANTFTTAVQTLCFDVVFSFVKSCLNAVPKLEEWKLLKNANPRIEDFNTPLPYITKIGEHLLTLPGQLEPFIDDSQLGAVSPKGAAGGVTSFAAQCIQTVGRATVTNFLQRIGEIPALTPLGAKQLAVDIAYLVTVLGALAVTPSPTLTSLLSVLQEPTQTQRTGDTLDLFVSSLVKKLRLGEPQQV